jgi:hypothetical protein
MNMLLVAVDGLITGGVLAGILVGYEVAKTIRWNKNGNGNGNGNGGSLKQVCEYQKRGNSLLQSIELRLVQLGNAQQGGYEGMKHHVQRTVDKIESMEKGLGDRLEACQKLHEK